ncbi:MAG: 50S ribosomal protein L35 [Verrucomicrobiota bacterium]
MAKLKHKTKKAIAKRFRRTARGKIKHASAGRGHLLCHKSRKRKRILRRGKLVSGADYDRIAGLLPK